MWERIKQVGVSSIFGVPGAFNLTLLDHIYPFEDLEWVGNTNDLNAGYAADGYARVKNGAGCVVTTHGVGELSALNAIAGAMTEHVKVIHVVGQTSRAMQTGRVMTHHSIGDSPDHQVFNVASQNFRVAAAELHKATDPTREIDRVLRECFVHSKPVYIFMPTDLVEQSVDATLLHHPLDLTPPFDQASVDSATTAILDALYASKRPSLFVDCLVQQHGAVAECRRLADALKIPVFTSNMGKGIIDETLPYYVGVCNGGKRLGTDALSIPALGTC
jgi:pyruvate decarboxylase